jgi:predicted  nucleic acid-binding Zn-ribbon protein
MTSACARTDEFITTVAREKQEMKAAKEAALAKEMEALGTPDQVRANETSVPEVFRHVTPCA